MVLWWDIGRELITEAVEEEVGLFFWFVVLPLYVIGVPSGDRLKPLPSMLLVKDHKRG
jgi:hypothetical protein